MKDFFDKAFNCFTYCILFKLGHMALSQFSKGFHDWQDFIWIDFELRNGTLRLNCTVDELSTTVNFIYPNDKLGYAFCTITNKTSSYCHCECKSTPTCRCNITQNIEQKTTSLLIKDDELTNMFGTYTCQHGFHSKSILADNCDMPSEVEGEFE